MNVSGTTPAPDPDRPGVARRLRRTLFWLLAVAAVPPLAGAVVLYAFQTRLIFPGSVTQGAPEAAVDPPTGSERVSLRAAGGERVAALFARALDAQGNPRPDAARCPTFLYFYGNGMCLRDAVDGDLERFRRLGVNVLIADYLGYGLSGGAPSERGCYETADAALAHLRAREDVDPSRIVAVGRSLGGAVAVDLAAREKLAGLVTLCTFTGMAEMAGARFPFLPARFLLRHKFDSLAKIGRVTCPALLGHGRLDTLVPFTMSERLARKAGGPARTFVVEGAGHNDLVYAVGEAQVVAELRAFLDALPASAGGR